MRKYHRRRPTKKSSLIRHSRRRAIERYGLDIGRCSQEAIANLIRGGRGVFLKRCSNRVSEWEVLCEGNLLRVLYDRKRRALVTILPPKRTKEERAEAIKREDVLPVKSSNADSLVFWEREANFIPTD